MTLAEAWLIAWLGGIGGAGLVILLIELLMPDHPRREEEPGWTCMACRRVRCRGCM